MLWQADLVEREDVKGATGPTMEEVSEASKDIPKEVKPINDNKTKEG